MPTRPNRRARTKRGAGAIEDGIVEPQMEEQRDRPAKHWQGSGTGMPSLWDCSVSAPAPAEYEVELGPLPAPVERRVMFEFMGLQYEADVPEDCGPGSYFKVKVANPNAVVENSPDSKADGLPNLSDCSTSAAELDTFSEEDPMWNMDWTAEKCLTASGGSGSDGDDAGLQRGEEQSDYCVEQVPDYVDFHNCTESTGLRCSEQRPEHVEVFELSDMSTWFTRLQQRREQALRSGKTKLVRKIDREIDFQVERCRNQQPTGSAAAFCNGQTDDRQAELDDIWDEDWSDLHVKAASSPKSA